MPHLSLAAAPWEAPERELDGMRAGAVPPPLDPAVSRICEGIARFYEVSLYLGMDMPKSRKPYKVPRTLRTLLVA